MHRTIDRLRSVCVAFFGDAEKDAWGDPTFRVRDRIFAMQKCGDGRGSVWFKARREAKRSSSAPILNGFSRRPMSGQKTGSACGSTTVPTGTRSLRCSGAAIASSHRSGSPRCAGELIGEQPS